MDNTDDSIDTTAGKVFTSQDQCSAMTGTPKEMLRAAKKQGAPGFRGSCVYWVELKPYLDAHKELLESKVQDNLKALTIEGKRLDNDLKKLEKKKLQLEYLDRREVTDFLIKLRLSFESIIKGWSSEIPRKVIGKQSETEINVIIDNHVLTLFNNFGDQIKDKMESFKSAKGS